MSGVRIPDGLDATLVLVRHGESTYIVEGRFQGQADVPLTALGERQAGLVAARLADPEARPALPIPGGAPREIVHSPLARTTRTAEVIAAAMPGGPAPLRAEPGLLEIAQGEWEGLHRDEIAARYGETLATWRRTPTEGWAPGGESPGMVAERAGPAIERILVRLAEGRPAGSRDRSQVAGYGEARSEHPWSIVVAHDGVFKVSLLRLFDLPLDRFWMWMMDLCAITIVEFRGGLAVLRGFNLTGHLAALQDEATVEATEARSASGAL